MSDSNDPPPYSEAIKKPIDGFPASPNVGSSATAPPYPTQNAGESHSHHSISAPHQNAPNSPSVVYISTNVYGPRPVNVVCPHCHQQVVTRIRPVAGLLTWLLCILLIIFGCTLGCCLIPFCMDDAQDVEHSCPNCKSYLQQYKRIGN